jgi:4-alpha-glucanotransferase
MWLRQSGILLHPTSLPGPGPMGTLGAPAHAWIDELAHAGQRWWQVLPLHPPGFGHSPYMATSAFAGHAALVDPDWLVELGLLPLSALQERASGPENQVDLDHALRCQQAWLALAFEAFEGVMDQPLAADVDAWARSQSAWLPDFALFSALHEAHDGACWTEWPAPLRDREAEALSRARATHARTMARVVFEQYLFERRWQRLREHAHHRGVKLLGDVPIFVAMHSADVWCHPGLFLLEADGQPSVVAGVPPDYFSPTGQRWGNPLYRWEAHRAQGYDWWVRRLQRVLALCDGVRIDHFRAFAQHWEIPATCPTAIDGRWQPGPGREVFDALASTGTRGLLLAEDLGTITPDVDALRRGLELPGMRVLQFGFGDDADNPHALANLSEDVVVYPGTHDNDTTVGWYQALDEATQHQVRSALGVDGSTIAWDLVVRAWQSPARLAIASAQDVLGLDGDHRMNTPGASVGNWGWRMPAGWWNQGVNERLRALTEATGRAG